MEINTVDGLLPIDFLATRINLIKIEGYNAIVVLLLLIIYCV